MLPDLTVPSSLFAALKLVGGSFTTPTFATFSALVTGSIAQTGQSTVTGMLSGAGLTRVWSHDRAHAFFSQARWNPDILGISLSHRIVRRRIIAARLMPTHPGQPTATVIRTVQQAWAAASADYAA
ncbi:hypothetical protein [Streptacidiphilus sp. EB129]|uniref:hypothetical protein n=1 Tax=Streptacidiphilus sp. EB129 TaxID=3156262 RepID=UPI0035145CB0